MSRAPWGMAVAARRSGPWREIEAPGRWRLQHGEVAHGAVKLRRRETESGILFFYERYRRSELRLRLEVGIETQNSELELLTPNLEFWMKVSSGKLRC